MFKFVEKLTSAFTPKAAPQPAKGASVFNYKAPEPTTREGWDPKTTPFRNSVDYKDYPMAG
ncbi:MAG: hypothetical protein JWO78_1309 [Micavibrio sp.]|nr:hypothetical protein [Micavibrio sp.]